MLLMLMLLMLSLLMLSLLMLSLLHLVEDGEPARNTGHPDMKILISFCINTIGQRYLFIRFSAVPSVSRKAYSENFTTFVLC